MSGAAAVSAAEVSNTLQLLGQQLTDSGHPLQAIKCYVACLSQSLMPTDEAATLLKLGHLLMEHTHNVQEAKQHLQKAEMLVMPLPGQQLLKCEVLAALATAHQALGEIDFQRRCYTKGLEQCKDVTASNADKHVLAEWSIYFHMHLAESLAAKGQTTEATQQVELAAALAASQGLIQQQVLCNLFKLQLAILHFERADVSAISASIQELLQQYEAQQEQQPDPAAERHLEQLKLHFLMLQVMMVVQSGSFKELLDSKDPKEGAAAAAATQASAILDQMDELLHQVAGPQLQAAQDIADKGTSSGAQQQQQQQSDWLPAPVMAAAVHLLAAEIDKNAGKQKQGQARIAIGLRVLDTHIAALMQDKVTASDATAQSRTQQELRACLCLRVLLLETRMQMHLLCSNFAAASADAAASISVLSQYPKLLAGLAPVVHMQAGLYAQAMTLYAAAVRHFMAAAAEAQERGMLHLATDARHMAAMCYMAQQDEASVKAARELIGQTPNESDADLGYGSRVLYHTVAGLLGLGGAAVTSDDRAAAKQHFSRALKMAHKHLHNHQVVSQLLLVMAPLQLAAADASGARSMISSCVQLSHGAGDLHTQVSALSQMQVLLAAGTDEEETAKNRNYVARKQQELSGRIQEAESEAQQHHLVLTWGLT